MSLERDIYKIYLEGPYDWLNPVDMFTEFLTDTSSGSWTSNSNVDEVQSVQCDASSGWFTIEFSGVF